jgi:hypothetical protein
MTMRGAIGRCNPNFIHMMGKDTLIIISKFKFIEF